MGKFSLLTNLTLNAAGFKTGVDKAKQDAKQLQKAVDGASNNMKSSFKGLVGSFMPMNQQFSIFNSGLGESLKSLKDMATAGKGFTQSLAFGALGVAIAAITAGILSMNAAMKRTDEGGSKMRAILNQLSSAADFLLNRVALLGMSLIDLLSGDTESAAKNFKKIFENLFGDAKNMMVQTNELTKIEEQLLTLNDTYATQKGELEEIIEKNKYLAEDQSKSNAERLAATQKAMKALKDLHDLEAKQAGLELKIAAKKQELDKNTHETRRVTNEAQAKLNDINANYYQQLTELNNKQNEINKGYQDELNFLNQKKQILGDLNDLQNNNKSFKAESVQNLDGNNINTDLAGIKTDSLNSVNQLNIEKETTYFDILKKQLSDVNNLLDIAKVGVDGFSDALLNLAETGQSSFKNMITSMLDALRKLMTALLAQAIGSMIAGSAKKGLWGLGAAVVGISLLQGLWKKHVPQFAGGGIVPGSSFTGDRNLIGVNSGEMILNRSQQTGLFKMLNNSPLNSDTNKVVFEIQGNTLVGFLNKQNRLTNRLK